MPDHARKAIIDKERDVVTIIWSDRKQTVDRDKKPSEMSIKDLKKSIAEEYDNPIEIIVMNECSNRPRFSKGELARFREGDESAGIKAGQVVEIVDLVSPCSYYVKYTDKDGKNCMAVTPDETLDPFQEFGD